MNKKLIMIVSLQGLFVIFAFIVLYLDGVCLKNMNNMKNENVFINEQIIELENDYLEIKEKGEEELNALESEKNSKEEQILELQKEIESFEKDKSYWNNKVAELEK